MALLSEKKVLNDIAEFKNEWKNQDWCYTFTDSYTNAVHGYYINVTKKIEAVVYELYRDEEDELEIGEVLFRFNIKH